MNDKYQIFSLSNVNNNFGVKLLIKSNKTVNILKMFANESITKSHNIIKLDLWNKKQIKIEPFSKMCCELSPDIFILCRYIDNVLQIKSEKQTFLYQFKCIITSIEFFSHNEYKNNTNNNIIHKNEILFGDEEGYLHLLKLEYEYNNKKKNFNLFTEKTKITKEIKAHNSFIQGILYVKRLNIIISYSEEGQITINNAFSFNILNIIELGNKYYIKNVKISEYDLLYIHCLNNINKSEYIKCYSLNGLKATKLQTMNKIIDFYIDEEIIVVYENNLIEFYKLYDLSECAGKIIPEIKGKKSSKSEDDQKIAFCDFLNKEMKMIAIYKNKQTIIHDLIILERKKI
jgi:hypothetical protein